jgi:pectin lyase
LHRQSLTCHAPSINSEQDFRTTEGAPITTWGCRPTSNKCGTSGQGAINQADWCCNGNAGCRSSECAATTDSKLNALPKCSITVKYDPAGLKPIAVGSNKSLVGVGANAALRGRGLRVSGSTNVIIQNVKVRPETETCDGRLRRRPRQATVLERH